MSVASRGALQDAQTELYRAQVTLLEVRSVLQDLWDHAQYEIYYRMLSIYRTSLTHIYRAAFDIQAQTEYHPQTRKPSLLPLALVSFDDTETL